MQVLRCFTQSIGCNSADYAGALYSHLHRTMKLIFSLHWAVLISILLAPPAIAGGSIPAGSSSKSHLTGAGAVDANPYPLTVPGGYGGKISFTSNGTRTGTFVTGASLAGFDGFWFSDVYFNVGEDLSGYTLNFSGLTGDDRVVLELNGVVIGDANRLHETGSGLMSFSAGQAAVPYTFSETTSGVLTTGFQTGLNTLRLIVNNTNGTGVTGPTATFQSSSDATYASVDAVVIYNQNVPEPSATFSMLIGVITLALFRRSSTAR